MVLTFFLDGNLSLSKAFSKNQCFQKYRKLSHVLVELSVCLLECGYMVKNGVVSVDVNSAAHQFLRIMCSSTFFFLVKHRLASSH